ncbi:MAG: c-type cytochrome biogenesis protein CcsB [Syntrophobacterales bacterium]|nr:c-type cytochrome biogenesis protein CcsB [Syntrophobacterales bacterium]
MNSSLLLSLSTFGWLFCSLLYLGVLIFQKHSLKKGALGVTIIILLVQGAGIILRWRESYELGIGHVPLTNLYESLVFGSWAIMAVYLMFVRRWQIVGLGVVPSLLAFLAMAYASFSPNVESRIQPLVPALKSNWLLAHVTTCFLGYGAFAISFGASLAYILKRKYEDKGFFRILPDAGILEKFNRQIIIFGFLWLTVGILTGAVWAESAWGNYWSWDPKETWSLITWLVYASVLHAYKNWSGQRIALISIVGFGCVIFTYFGVNFLLSGLHSYGAR